MTQQILILHCQHLPIRSQSPFQTGGFRYHREEWPISVLARDLHPHSSPVPTRQRVPLQQAKGRVHFRRTIQSRVQEPARNAAHHAAWEGRASCCAGHSWRASAMSCSCCIQEEPRG